MNIKSIEEVTRTYHYIETDNEPFSTYRRWGPESYEILMGESWEAWYEDKELEELFQNRMMYGT